MQMRVESIAKALYLALVASLAAWCWSAMAGDWLTRTAVLVLASPLIVFASAFLAPVVAVVAALIKGAELLMRGLARVARPRSPV